MEALTKHLVELRLPSFREMWTEQHPLVEPQTHYNRRILLPNFPGKASLNFENAQVLRTKKPERSASEQPRQGPSDPKASKQKGFEAIESFRVQCRS